MIILLSECNDETSDFLEGKLIQRSLNYKRINVQNFPDQNISFSISSKCNIYSFIDLSSVSGIFCRYLCPVSEKYSQSIPAEFKRFVEYECSDVLLSIFLSCKQARWMNSISGTHFASIKVNQLQIAQEKGWKIPDTILSANKSDLIDFWNHKKGLVITKAIHQGWLASNPNGNKVIFTNKVKEEHLNKLLDFNYPPVLFQEMIIKKHELRIVVIGNNCYACSMGSTSSVDWRTDQQAILGSSVFQLPDSISHASIDVVKALGLSFGVLDVIVTPDGEFYFLEVNPQGGWIWMDKNLNIPIGNAIVDFLMNS